MCQGKSPKFLCLRQVLETKVLKAESCITKFKGQNGVKLNEFSGMFSGTALDLERWN